MNCLLCDSKKHYTCNCSKYNYYVNYFRCMNKKTCPDFNSYSTKLLRVMAYNFVMKKTFYKRSYFYNDKNNKYYDPSEKLPKKLEVKRLRLYRKYDYDPIPVTLNRSQLIMRLKERWKNCYYPLMLKKDEEVKDLEKCVVCTSTVVKMKYWNVIFQKYMDVYVEDECSTHAVLGWRNYGEPPVVCSVCNLTICFKCMSNWIPKKRGFSCPQCRSTKRPIVPKYVFNKGECKMVTYLPDVSPVKNHLNRPICNRTIEFYYMNDVYSGSHYALCRKTAVKRCFTREENMDIYDGLIRAEQKEYIKNIEES